MANRNKARGTAHETAIVNYLKDRGLNAYRVAQTGRLDQGDIHTESDWVIEAKNVKDITLAEFVRQAKSEAQNAGRKYGIAVVKKRNANISAAYCVMDLETLARIMHDMRGTDGRTGNP